jgi:hypothetical protein
VGLPEDLFFSSQHISNRRSLAGSALPLNTTLPQILGLLKSNTVMLAVLLLNSVGNVT